MGHTDIQSVAGVWEHNLQDERMKREANVGQLGIYGRDPREWCSGRSDPQHGLGAANVLVMLEMKPGTLAAVGGVGFWVCPF